MKKINNILDIVKLNCEVQFKYLMDDGALVQKVIICINENANNDTFVIFESKYEKNYAEEKYYVKTRVFKKTMQIIK